MKKKSNVIGGDINECDFWILHNEMWQHLGDQHKLTNIFQVTNA